MRKLEGPNAAGVAGPPKLLKPSILTLPIVWLDGGAEGVRTPDLLNAIQALYQLSYDPIRSEEECKELAQDVKGILRDNQDDTEG